MNIPGVLNISKVIDIARLYVRHLDKRGDVAHVNCDNAIPRPHTKSVTLELKLIDKDGKQINKTLRCERVSVRLDCGKFVNIQSYYSKMDDKIFYVHIDGMDDNKDLVHVERYLWDRLRDKQTDNFHDSLKVMMNSILKLHFVEETKLYNIINCYSSGHDNWINVVFTVYIPGRPGQKNASLIDGERNVDTYLKSEESICQLFISELDNVSDEKAGFHLRLGVKCEGEDNEWSYKFAIAKKMVDELLSTRP